MTRVGVYAFEVSLKVDRARNRSTPSAPWSCDVSRGRYDERVKQPDAAALRRRWTADRLVALREQILEQSRIVKGPHRFETEWSRTDEGRLDLRGLSAGRDGLQFRFVTLADVDFRLTRGRLLFFESEVTDCLFDAVSLSGQPRFDRSLVRCSFQGATMRRLAIGTRVTECDFAEADLRSLRSLPNTRFERCVFDGADLGGAEFADATFVDCTFVGTSFSAGTSFTRCAFVDSPLTLGLARLTRSTFDGVPVPDRWDGEAQSDAALEAHAQRYAAAAAAGNADDLPRNPER